MTDPDLTELPEALRPLGFLIGTWHGDGVGAIPEGRGPDFPYTEQMTFAWDGASPWLQYETRATDPVDGELLHTETGWWRAQPAAADGTVHIDVVPTHPTGVAEVLIGQVVTDHVGEHVDLVSDVVARTATAPPVTAESRLYALRGGKLMYAIDLAAGESTLAPHLAAALDRVETPSS
jgi:THAP4-like, heme-binding beta-barrel domain